jgi:putative mRNA 3-end processing factor
VPRPSKTSWVKVTPSGLYVVPGDFFVDPLQPVARAVITHGHGDHARGGHANVLATPQTLDIMALRYGAAPGTRAAGYGETLTLGDVNVRLEPAGHILGSAQVVMEHAGSRIVVSGDYKRRPDPTCPPFVPAPCDVFITEATFALPVFCHPPALDEIDKLLHSLKIFPDRTHLVGAYALGKTQRIIMLLRQRGYDRPIYLHGALIEMCKLYERHGVALGPWRPATGASTEELKGQIVLCPPGDLKDRWSRRMHEPVIATASGWMRIRQRAKQGGVELPLVISDHADWDELLDTAQELRPGEVWITHGREEALAHALGNLGIPAKPLSLAGYEDEAE